MHSKQQKRRGVEKQLDIDMGLDRGIYYTLLSSHCLPLAKEGSEAPWWARQVDTTQELN